MVVGVALGLEEVGVTLVPVADAVEDHDAEEGDEGEPFDLVLAAGDDDEGSEEGAEGGAGVASHLEEGLGEAVASTGGHAGDAGGFGVEDGGADANEGDGDEDDGEAGGDGEEAEAGEGEAHADGEGVGEGTAVGVPADEGLEEGGGELVGEGNEADLGEAELEAVLEDGVDGGDEGLHGVVEQVGDAQGDEDAEDGFLGRAFVDDGARVLFQNGAGGVRV